MSVENYIEAGEKELLNSKFYEQVNDDPTNQIKHKVIDLVSRMFKNGEIADKVADYMLSGDVKLSNFYLLVKTHKLPHDVENLS